MFKRIFFAALLTAVGAGFSPAADTPPAAEDILFFEKKIRPVLVTHCYPCHSAQAPQIKGGLVLDTRAGVERGGETGPVVVAKDPAASLLIQALKYADDAPAMPPRKKLPDEVIADFEHWVKRGSPDPRDGQAAVVRHEIDIEKGRQFWSFVPPKLIEPPRVKNSAWPVDAIDHFLLASMEERGIGPVGDCDPYSFVRRLYFDLVGLPPAVEEVEKYAQQLTPLLAVRTPSNTDRAMFEKQQGEGSRALEALVDSLLASSHFGERWGRHWLDVARYAETSGRQINYNYPHAWRYRDWVIDALNSDKPYDQFVREQIAGDLMPADNARQKAQRQIATGLLAIGPKPHSERNTLQFQMDLADEQIDVVSQAFLGLTVACARCHDHKFDPISQRDYYALAGIFRSSETCYGTIRIIQSLNPSPVIELPAGEGIPLAAPPLSVTAFAELKRQLAEVKDRFDSLTKAGKPTTGTDFNLLGTLTSRVASYNEDGVPKLFAVGMRERATPHDSPLFQRGEIDQPGERVPRGFVQVLPSATSAIPPQASGRLELADWLASQENPLTARVFVNRVWTHLFGRGLVPSPDNFGAAGMMPDHPQLLDHLAVSFMNDGWSTKRLIRRIVLSRAYRLSSQHHPGNQEADPDNVLVWRMTLRRLEAEALRDALLDASGQLNKTPAVGSPVALAGENGSVVLMRQLVALDTRNLHRAVYLPVIRDGVLESLALFDFADPSLVVSQRAATTVPIQGLYLMNNPFVLAQADAAAERLIAETPEPHARVNRAFLRFLGRPATPIEHEKCLAFIEHYAKTLAEDKLAAHKRPVAVWGALCQSLLSSADFLYLR